MQQVTYVIGCFATPESDKKFGVPAVFYDRRTSDLVWEVGLFRSCLCSLKWPVFKDGVIFQCSFAGMGGMVGCSCNDVWEDGGFRSDGALRGCVL